MTIDAWFAPDQLTAILQSSAYPADEWDREPLCDQTIDSHVGALVCTRSLNHDGRHLAAERGRFKDDPESPLYAIAAAWPGTDKPVTHNPSFTSPAWVHTADDLAPTPGDPDYVQE